MNTAPLPPSLSVVVLGYRAGDGLRDFVDDLRASLDASGDSYELVLVVNDWADRPNATAAVARELAADDGRIVVVDRAKEGGMGWDMRSGFAVARGERVAVIDGDGQMPGADVVRVAQAMAASGTDFGKTWRSTRGDGFRRRVLSAGFNSLFRALFPGLAVRDVNSKPKVVRRELLERMELAADDWFVDAEMLLAARRLGVRIVEVPTSFAALASRPSFVSAGAVLEFCANLARARLREWRR